VAREKTQINVKGTLFLSPFFNRSQERNLVALIAVSISPLESERHSASGHRGERISKTLVIPVASARETGMNSRPVLTSVPFANLAECQTRTLLTQRLQC